MLKNVEIFSISSVSTNDELVFVRCRRKGLGVGYIIGAEVIGLALRRPHIIGGDLRIINKVILSVREKFISKVTHKEVQGVGNGGRIF